MKEIELLISQFADGELPPEEQGEFFKALSLDAGARKMLNDYISLKGEVKGVYSNMEADLSGVKIPPLPVTPIRNIYKPLFYFSAAAVLILLASSLLIYSNFISLNRELNSAKAGFNNIKLELEGLKKEKDVFRTSLVSNSDAKPIKGKIREKSMLPVKAAILPDESRKEFLAYKQEKEKVQVVQITKADFITTPMIGN